jgi:hypothetical protein
LYFVWVFNRSLHTVTRKLSVSLLRFRAPLQLVTSDMELSDLG